MQYTGKTGVGEILDLGYGILKVGAWDMGPIIDPRQVYFE